MDWRFLVSLFFCIIVETAVLVLYVRIVSGSVRGRWQEIVFAGILATLASFPYLWFLIPRYFQGYSFWLAGEGMVVVLEAAVIRFALRTSWQQALNASLFCNASSLALGKLLLEIGASL